MILLSDVRRRVLGDLIIDGELTIVETLTTDQVVVTNANTGPAILINQTGTHAIAEFQANGTTTLLIKGNKVGIGTNSPSEALDVQGTAKVQSLIVGTSSGILHSTSGVVTASKIVDDDVSPSAAIDWSKVSKVGSSINNLGPASQNYSFDNYRLTDLGNPLEAQDAATKNFVESALAAKAFSTLEGVSLNTPSSGQILIINQEGQLTNRSVSGAVFIDSEGSSFYSEGSITNSSISNFASIELSKLQALNSNKVLVTDTSGIIDESEITTVELSFLSGIESSVQAQLNNKQPIGEYITSLTGDVEAPSSGISTITSQTVVGKLLVGFSAPGPVQSTDSILSAIEKLSAKAHDSLTLGSTNGLTLVDQQLSLSTASASTTGALLVTDWHIFNNKEPAIITLPIEKGGTNNSYLDVSGGNIITADGEKLVGMPIGQEGELLTISEGQLVWSDLCRAPSYSDDTRPLATTLYPGTIIFNTDDGTLNVSDGYDWRDMVGTVT